MTYLEKIDLEKEALARRTAVDFAINNLALRALKFFQNLRW